MTVPRRPAPSPAARIRTAGAASGSASAAAAPASHSPAASEAPCLDSAHLLRGHGSVAISHRGAIYRLQETRQGKLILTK